MGRFCFVSFLGEGTQPGKLTQIGQRDILGHMTLCSAMKVQGKEDEVETFMVMVFVFPSEC